MRLSSQAVWCLAASLAWLGAAVNAAADNVMEVELVFPRPGEVYAPTPYMPIVFALRNPNLAQYTDPYINFRVWNRSNDVTYWDYRQPLDGANRTSDELYFAYTLLDKFAQPAAWRIYFDLWWYSCKMDPAGDFRGYKADHCECQTSIYIEFSTKDGGKAIDVAAITDNEGACTGKAVIVGETPMQLNETFPGQEGTSSQCVLVSPVAAQAFNDTKSCPVKIDSATAAAISANVTSATCAGPNPPSSCPPKSAAHQRLAAVVGPAFLATAVGLFQLLA